MRCSGRSRRGCARGGVDIRPTLPVSFFRRRLSRMDVRNHRKIVVIDGRIGHTGSKNLIDAEGAHVRCGPWGDIMARMVGPVVLQLQLVFLEDWRYVTGLTIDEPELFPAPAVAGDVLALVVPSGPTYATDAILHAIVAAIHEANERVVISTPYFIPDQPTLLALQIAAARGVRVELIVPLKADHLVVQTATRAFVTDLLDSGGNVYFHTRGLLHSKTLTVDQDFAMIGSANFDVRSFYLNFETNLLLYGSAGVSAVISAQDRYRRESEEVDRAAWAARSNAAFALEHAAKLFSPLL